MINSILETHHHNNPIDMIAELVKSKGFTCSKSDDDCLDITVTGKHSDLTIHLTWQEDFAALIVACLTPIEIHDNTHEATVKILEIINKNVWLGHFDLSGDDETIYPTFRHTLLLNMVPVELSMHLIADVIDIAIAESDRFYKTFQQAQEGDIRLHDGLDAVVFETVGEA